MIKEAGSSGAALRRSLRVPRLDEMSDVVAFCRRLTQVEKVLLVLGECFGSPQHVRLGFGGSTGDLKEGLRRLSCALAANPRIEGSMVGRQRLELWTRGLKVRCSTN
jgi:hypothetical protein